MAGVQQCLPLEHERLDQEEAASCAVENQGTAQRYPTWNDNNRDKTPTALPGSDLVNISTLCTQGFGLHLSWVELGLPRKTCSNPNTPSTPVILEDQEGLHSMGSQRLHEP